MRVLRRAWHAELVAAGALYSAPITYVEPQLRNYQMPSTTPRRTVLAPVAAFLFFSACTTSSSSTPAVTPVASGLPDSAMIRADIEVLASTKYEGRETGTPGNDSAAAYLSRRYAALRLETPRPVAGCGAGCSRGYLLPFTGRETHREGPATSFSSNNVAGVVRGTDAALRDEYVVIGAHFDHLGRSPRFAMDPNARDEIRNGADDNASGSAAILALARRFAAHPAKRSIVVVHFSAEELGLIGSARFVEDSPVPVAKMAAMVNFDMVGRMRDDKLIVYGVGTAAEMRALVDSSNTAGLKLAPVPDGTGPSDHSSFYLKDMPVLHFFTDTHEDYHRATDDAEKVNVAGTVKVVDIAERVIRRIADRPTRLTFTKVTTPTRAVTAGNGAYFGSIPDMASGDEAGMRLSGVSPGGPAEKAGIKGGDLIIEFGGKAVKNIYDYTDAIGAYKPGDEITVIVLRGPAKERLAIKVTLGRRGG
jgi:hypothetical protein